MDLFPLPLFPHGSLASSVITTVWIGVLVVAFFNLRFGWVFSGLVVPGYVVPLMMTKPWSAGVVLFEGIITFLIVRFLSERPARLPYWCSLFGRDRFFALLLFSVIIRLTFDGWLLPIGGEAINQYFGIQIDYRNNLHSFGLIIIALLANQFWKTGLIRGLIPLVVTIGVTYLIIRYGLMELTNFSISKLNFMYEDLAASVLASPKAYIILLTTAFLASRMNLIYGWDFNGILIPSLIALQWYQPSKVLTTFLEAFLILWLATLVLKMPLFTRMNVEGARKVLLFFNLGYALKMLVGYAVPFIWPDLKVTDAYGFGYLLATFMAIRMYDQDVIARLMRATLQTSLTAVVAASAVGFALTLLFIPQGWSPASAGAVGAAVVRVSDTSLPTAIQRDRVVLFQSEDAKLSATALPREMEWFRDALYEIGFYTNSGDEGSLQAASDLLNRLDYEIQVVEDHYLYIREKEPVRGRGLYVIDTQPKSSLVIEVPAALDERSTTEAATVLFRSLGAQGLAIAGTRRTARSDGSSDMLQSRRTLFQTFHRTLGRDNALQIRGREARARNHSGERSTLWVSRSLPTSLDLTALREFVRGLDVVWSPPSFSNVQRDLSRDAFTELILDREDIRQVVGHAMLASGDVALQVSDPRIDGYLQDWLFGTKERIASRGSNAYQPPRLEELIYLDEEVITPLLHIKNAAFKDGDWTATGLNELRNIDTAAHVLGYEIIRFRHRRTKQSYLILAEQETANLKRFWGTYAFRLGPAKGFIIQIPRPGYEINSFEFGASLFERLNAEALLIAGAHPDANLDESADILRLENTRTMFTLVHQVILREAGDSPRLSVQTRAFKPRDPNAAPAADVLFSVSSGVYQPDRLDVLSRLLVDALNADALMVRIVDGALETAGYETGLNPQSLYLDASRNKLLGTLWVSPFARHSYRAQSENRILQVQHEALDIPTLEYDLHEYLAQHNTFADYNQLPNDFKETLNRYIDTYDIVTLQRLRSQWPNYRLARLIDVDTRQAFLVVKDTSAEIHLIANLAPLRSDQVVESPAPPSSEIIDRFLASRAGKLTFSSRL